jgi:hypothetical protein
MVRISGPLRGPEGTMTSLYGGVPPSTVIVFVPHCVGLFVKLKDHALTVEAAHSATKYFMNILFLFITLFESFVTCS